MPFSLDVCSFLRKVVPKGLIQTIFYNIASPCSTIMIRFGAILLIKKMPRNFELREERVRNILREPAFMKLVEKICESINGDLRKHCACAQFPCDCILPNEFQ